MRLGQRGPDAQFAGGTPGAQFLQESSLCFSVPLPGLSFGNLRRPCGACSLFRTRFPTLKREANIHCASGAVRVTFVIDEC